MAPVRVEVEVENLAIPSFVISSFAIRRAVLDWPRFAPIIDQ
jgi:hypothetical protein